MKRNPCFQIENNSKWKNNPIQNNPSQNKSKWKNNSIQNEPLKIFLVSK